MDKWNERFSTHTVHAAVFDFLNEIESLDLKLEEASQQDDFERLKIGVEYIKDTLSECLHYLANPRLLDKIRDNLISGQNELRNYKTDKNQARLGSVSAAVEAAIQQVQSLPFAVRRGGEASITSVITLYSKKFQQMLNEALVRQNELDSGYKRTRNDFEALNSDLKGLANLVRDQQNSINNLSADYQKQFGEQQESRRREFADKIKEVQEKIGSLISDASESLEKQKRQLQESNASTIKAFSENVDELMQALADKDVQASRLLEAVGIKSHTYGYAGVSKKEGELATRLRGYAIFFMVIAVAMLVGPSVYELVLENKPFDWKGILFRIPTSIIVFIPAFYLAREASKHRDVEVENKRIELELAALSPYLELFSNEEKNKIKQELVGNYFIGHNHNIDFLKENDEKTKWLSQTLPEIIEKVLDKVLERLPSLDKKQGQQ